MGASAVPTSTVASAPALQWVISLIPSRMSPAPHLPMALHLSTVVCAYSSAASTGSCPEASLEDIQSTAWNRSYAVGLADLISFAASARSHPFSAARHIPYAAEAPMDGAPRVVILRMASATSRWFPNPANTSFDGSSR